MAHHIPQLGVDNDDLPDSQIKLVVTARVNEEWKQVICVPKARNSNTEFSGEFVLTLLPLLLSQRRSIYQLAHKYAQGYARCSWTMCKEQKAQNCSR